jgi:hypothetical protein
MRRRSRQVPLQINFKYSQHLGLESIKYFVHAETPPILKTWLFTTVPEQWLKSTSPPVKTTAHAQ